MTPDPLQQTMQMVIDEVIDFNQRVLSEHKAYNKRYSDQIRELNRPSEELFDGSDYVAPRDDKRLTAQMERIFNLMQDGQFRTLKEIAERTQDPEASISAQLRHFRKARFGSHTLNKKYLGNGLYSYQLVV